MPKLCEFETCRNRATYGLNCNPIRCFEHKENNMKLSSSLCLCGKQAIFNFNDMKPKFCIGCRKDGMVDLRNAKSFCGKSQPRYNYEGMKPCFCNNCRSEGMVNLVFKKCECGKRAIYNFEGNPSKFCIDCKQPNMINLESKKCHCGKNARYNLPNLKPKYCSECKTNNMIDVHHKKCKCGKSRPTFNFEGLSAEYCVSCKEIGMKNVVDKKCKCGKSQPSFNFEGLSPEYCSLCREEGMKNIKCKLCKCNKSYPTFNYEGLKPEYCLSCRKDNMINVKDNRCKCNKARPTFNYKGLKAEYCVSCRKNDMINVKDDRCKAENCETVGNKNYKGYCANCFQHLFPTDPLTFQIRSKTKEIAVRDFINSRFEGFQHDKPLWYNETACDCTTKRRIDHRKLINDTLLCIETDENQHKSYSKEDEIARYNDLFMAFGGKFIFIRFNPDKYKDNGKSCNPMLVNRLPVLETEINKQIKRIETNENTELLEVIELYYDKNK